jgi:hypothetical protein
MDVIGQVDQNHQIQDCMVLVNWAHVASTFGPAAGPAGQNTIVVVPLGVVGNLRVPLADGPLSARCWAWILEDLPALGRTGTTTLERQFLQQNATLGHLLVQHQVDDATAAAWHTDRVLTRSLHRFTHRPLSKSRCYVRLRRTPIYPRGSIRRSWPT